MHSIAISAQETQPVSDGELVRCVKLVTPQPYEETRRGAPQKWKCQVVIHPQVRFFVRELTGALGIVL